MDFMLSDMGRACLPADLNAVQRVCKPVVMDQDFSFVLSAPTGAGKSICLAMAMLRALEFHKCKTIYIAPTKALCHQQLQDWRERFEPIGLKCAPLTGDDGAHAAVALDADVIFATPEKLDTISRHWKDHRRYFQTLGLVLIDEVHLLSEGRRGATLESMVSRLAYCKHETLMEGTPRLLRFGAVSATIPNVNDLASWLGAPIPQGVLVFGEAFRPIPLRFDVLGYSARGLAAKNEFMFEKELNKRLPEVVGKYGQGKPALIFCTSRKDAKTNAESLSTLHALAMLLSDAQIARRTELANTISDDPALRQCLLRGVGWHTAAVLPRNLRVVETMFKEGLLSILTCTTTLAMGVNLPAYLVIVKNTKAYRGTGKGMEDIPKTTILQMTGRAGRVGFGTNGTAIVMTREGEEHKYRQLLAGAEPVSSCMRQYMREVLVTEIVLESIQTVGSALQWLESTFLFHAEGKTNQQKANLRNLVLAQLRSIRTAGCAMIDESTGTIEATPLGEIAFKFHLRLNTVTNFEEMWDETNNPNLFTNESFQLGNFYRGAEVILPVLAKAKEFDDLVLRRDQKRWLNEVNWEHGKFKNKKGKNRVSDIPDKVFQLLQALLGQVQPKDQQLRFEMGTVHNESIRVLKGFIVYLESAKSSLVVYCQILLRCITTKMWPDLGTMLQLDQIGPKMLTKLGSLGVCDVNSFLSMARTKYELLVDEIGKTRLPKSLQAAREIQRNMCTLDVKVNIGFPRNRLILTIKTANSNATETPKHAIVPGFQVFVCHLGALVFHEFLRANEGEKSLEVEKEHSLVSLKVFAVHEKYHGLDMEWPNAHNIMNTVKTNDEKGTATISPSKKKQRSNSSVPVQSSMSKYFEKSEKVEKDGGCFETKNPFNAANNPFNKATVYKPRIHKMQMDKPKMQKPKEKILSSMTTQTGSDRVSASNVNPLPLEKPLHTSVINTNAPRLNKSASNVNAPPLEKRLHTSASNINALPLEKPAHLMDFKSVFF